MSFSSGTRNAVLEGLGWLVIAGCVVVVVTQIDVGKLRGAAVDMAKSTAVARDARDPAPRGKLSQQSAPELGVVELALQRDGHYHADADVNGRSVPVLVDTGATVVALTYDDAAAAGIFVRPGDFTAVSQTANGIARFAPVTIDRLSIGGITVRDVQAAVAERGKLGVTLLGMAFLSKLNRVEMRDGKLVLQE